jgi:hypothetical protein
MRKLNMAPQAKTVSEAGAEKPRLLAYAVQGYHCPRLVVGSYSIHEAKRLYKDAYGLSRARSDDGITATLES